MVRRFLETMGAGFIVYVMFAACSGAGNTNKSKPTATATTAGQSSMGGQDGQGGLSSGGSPDEPTGAGMAGMLDPVPPANAAGNSGSECECPVFVPPEPVIVEAACDLEGGLGVMFAEAEFPGRSAAELVHVIAVLVNDPELTPSYPTAYPPGYYDQAMPVHARDGWVATGCGAATTSVRFVLAY